MTRPLTDSRYARSDTTDTIVRIAIGDPAPPPLVPRTEEEIIAGWRGLGPPLVTCICHAYNHIDFIENALQGILGQITPFPFEVIVHDDASTDGTAEVIREFRERYPRLLSAIPQKENQYRLGKKPLWFTLPKAQGQLIALCEADDYWIDERKLATQAEQLGANPWAALAHHDAIVVEDGVVRSLSKLPRGNRRNFTAAELQRGPWLLTPSLMFRRESRRAIPENYGRVLNGDKLLLSVIGLVGGAVHTSTLKPAVYRRHAGGVWSQRSPADRRARRFETYCSLSLYHRTESGRADLADYFLLEGVRVVRQGREERLRLVGRFLLEEISNALRGAWARARRSVPLLDRQENENTSR